MEKKEKEHIKICGISIWRILAYFVVYSVAGFIIETIFGLLTKGVLESRKSFLYGPFCSIYGLGAVLMILPLQKYKKNNYTLFFAGFFIGSIIEYMVSLVGELIFHIKWWDYSDQMFNINGRICVLFSLFWGLLAIYLMLDINPRIDKFIDFVKSKIPANYMKTVIIFSILFLSFDLGITVYALQMFSVRIIHENNLNVSNKQLMDTLYEKIYVNDQKQKDFSLRHRAVRQPIHLSLSRPEPEPAADGAGVAAHHLRLYPVFGGRAAERHPRHLLHMVHRHGAGKGVGRFPLYPLFPAGHGGHGAGLPAYRRDGQHLLSVPFAAAGLCHAVPGSTGAAVLCHPRPGEILWLFCGSTVGAQLSGRAAAAKAEPAAQHGERLAVLWPDGLSFRPRVGTP